MNPMKIKLLVGTMWLMAGMCLASPPRVWTWSGTQTGATIADNDPNGWATQFHVSGVDGTVTNVSVTLDISGGFNGDLYAYLIDPSGTMAVLLNRVGVTSGNDYGNGDTGFQITLSGLADPANNIHNYQGNGNAAFNGSGQLSTGGFLWAADGRNIDPLSSGSAFDSASALAGLGVFNGAFPVNGDWTFFIADLGAGGTANLHSVMLNILTPEPQAWAIMGGGLAVLWLFRRR